MLLLLAGKPNIMPGRLYSSRARERVETEAKGVTSARRPATWRAWRTENHIRPSAHTIAQHCATAAAVQINDFIRPDGRDAIQIACDGRQPPHATGAAPARPATPSVPRGIMHWHCHTGWLDQAIRRSMAGSHHAITTNAAMVLQTTIPTHLLGKPPAYGCTPTHSSTLTSSYPALSSERLLISPHPIWYLKPRSTGSNSKALSHFSSHPTSSCSGH